MPPLWIDCLSVPAVVMDLNSAGQGRVYRAIAIAGHVEGVIDLFLVVLAVPPDHKSDLDLREPPRPVLLLLAFDLDRQRLERLLELLEQEHGVQTGAGTQRPQQHLRRPHRLVVSEDRSLVHARAVAGGGLDVELDLLSGPSSRDLRHGPNDSRT